MSLFYILSILTLVIAALQIDNLRIKKPIKRENTKALIILSLLIITTIITAIVENKNRHQAIINKKIDDSIADVKSDTRVQNISKVIINGIGEALGKYGLKYDSARKEIDSLRVTIKSIKVGPVPYVAWYLKLNKKTKDSIIYNNEFAAQFAPATLLNGVAYEFYTDYSIENYKGSIYHSIKFSGKFFLFQKGIQISPGISLHFTSGILLPGHDANKIKTIICVVKYSYTDSHNLNQKYVQFAGSLDLNSTKFGFLLRPISDSLFSLVKKY